jgi:hypothetical protein
LSENNQKLPNGRIAVLDGHNYGYVDIVVGIDDAINKDIEEWNDFVSEEVSGSPLLMDISWEVIGLNTKVGLLLRVHGDFSAILECMEEEESSPEIWSPRYHCNNCGEDYYRVDARFNTSADPICPECGSGEVTEQPRVAEDDECPNCRCGTLEETDTEITCRGECGTTWCKHAHLELQGAVPHCGGDIIVDVSCRDCGKSGSLLVTSDMVNW